MSLLNFLGEFALFNLICNWFSDKSKHLKHTQQLYPHSRNAEYDARVEELQSEIRDTESRIAEYRNAINDCQLYDIDDYDILELQDRITALECQLDDCDVMSSRYDLIQDKIDALQEQLDDIEDRQDMYDDLQDELDELDDLYEELDDMGYDDDCDW